MLAVILAGGGGTRLWPRSRRASPKQFLRLFGEKTLLELTADRVAGVIQPDQLFFGVTPATRPLLERIYPAPPRARSPVI